MYRYYIKMKVVPVSRINKVIKEMKHNLDSDDDYIVFFDDYDEYVEKHKDDKNYKFRVRYKHPSDFSEFVRYARANPDADKRIVKAMDKFFEELKQLEIEHETHDAVRNKMRNKGNMFTFALDDYPVRASQAQLYVDKENNKDGKRAFAEIEDYIETEDEFWSNDPNNIHRFNNDFSIQLLDKPNIFTRKGRKTYLKAKVKRRIDKILENYAVSIYEPEYWAKRVYAEGKFEWRHKRNKEMEEKRQKYGFDFVGEFNRLKSESELTHSSRRR